MPLFKYFGLIKEGRYGRSAGGLCTFPCSCKDREGDGQLSEIPSFRIQPYLSWHVITYPQSYCLGLLRKMFLSKECVPGQKQCHEAAGWDLPLGSSRFVTL